MTTRNFQEAMEDFLETVCILLENKEEIVLENIRKYVHLSSDETAELAGLLEERGYLELDGEKVNLLPFGRIRGEEALSRHRYLTEFIKCICGVDEEKAEQNACRMEHVIDEDVFTGICAFMHGANTYDRVMTGNDLNMLLMPGNYEFIYSVYRPDTRYPRQLAADYLPMGNYARVDVGESSCFILPCPQNESDDEEVYPVTLWYCHKEKWFRAKACQMGWEIPSEAFFYHQYKGSSLIDAELDVALAVREEEIEKNRGALVVHLWK